MSALPTIEEEEGGGGGGPARIQQTHSILFSFYMCTFHYCFISIDFFSILKCFPVP